MGVNVTLLAPSTIPGGPRQEVSKTYVGQEFTSREEAGRLVVLNGTAIQETFEPDDWVRVEPYQP